MTGPPLAAALLLVVLSPQAGPAPGDLIQAEEAAFKAAAAAVAGSTVRIETLGGADTAGGRLLATGPTTGVIVSPDGLILTSSFAFAGDPSSVLVRLPDGRRLAAERLGTDESRGLTLLRVDADGLTPAVPADVNALRVGDWVVAAGRTYSADDVNVSVGIVSATGRILGRAVQTDAKTSPANYGGPLATLDGRTIGVLAPLSGDGGTGGVEWYDSGIGFAVPLADVLPVLDRLAAGETLRPGKLGVTFAGAALDAAPVLDSVRPQSPADAAGLRAGDWIVSIAGAPVDRPDAAKRALGPLRAGDRAEISALRDGETITVTATLADELPPPNPGSLGVLPGEVGDPGEDGERPPGVPLAFVFPDSPAAAAGLAAGDVIVAAAGEPVAAAADLRRIVVRRAPGSELELELAGGERVTASLAPAAADPPDELPPFADPAADPLPADRSGRVSLDLPQFETAAPAFVPARTGRAGFGLLVALHAPDAADAGPLLDALAPAAEEHGLIVLAPRAANPAGWSPGDLPALAAAVERAVERYGVDPARASLLGLGKSGAVAWAVATASPETYAGVVAPADLVPPRLPEADADAPLRALLLTGPEQMATGLGPEGIARRDLLRRAGYPYSPLILPDVAAPPAGDPAAALVRWAATLDRI